MTIIQKWHTLCLKSYWHQKKTASSTLNLYTCVCSVKGCFDHFVTRVLMVTSQLNVDHRVRVILFAANWILNIHDHMWYIKYKYSQFMCNDIVFNCSHTEIHLHLTVTFTKLKALSNLAVKRKKKLTQNQAKNNKTS